MTMFEEGPAQRQTREQEAANKAAAVADMQRRIEQRERDRDAALAEITAEPERSEAERAELRARLERLRAKRLQAEE